MIRPIHSIFIIGCLLVGPPSAIALGGNPKIFTPSGASTSTAKNLSNSEISLGLKEALWLGAKQAARQASRVDGFYKNPLIFIPFPPEARQMKNSLEAIGFKPQIDRFTKTLNRAAEEAAKKAAPIFIDAIKGLTIQDALNILRGPDNAATLYLQRKTNRQLTRAFQPVVHDAVQKVQLTRYWTPLVTRYNQIPFFQPVNPDLDEYVTERATQGLFKLIAKEEKKIRDNPSARVTDILRRVFGQ